MKLRLGLCCLILGVCFATVVAAQDAVKTDPAHYKIESENAQVRVLRVHYGPHEKSIMHSHPNSVAVYLTDGHVKFTDPAGKTIESTVKSGQVQYVPAGTHNPENLDDKPFELILIELKGGKK